MKTEIKLVVVAVAISLGLTVGYNLLLPQKVKEVVREVVTLGSAGNSYGEIVEFQDGASFAGGVLRGAGKVFDSGTTTVCSLKTPNSTTTYWGPFVNITKNATTTARVFTIATSTVPYATTTDLWSGNIDAGVKTHLSVPFATSSQQARIAAPNTYFTVSFKGGNHIAGVGTTTELDGTCSVIYLGEGR